MYYRKLTRKWEELANDTLVILKFIETFYYVACVIKNWA